MMQPLTPDQELLSARLSNHVKLLAGDIGARSLTFAPENLKKAAEYIEFIFKTYNLLPRREEFQVEAFSEKNRKITTDSIVFKSIEHTTFNVIAELTGTSNPTEIVIVGAHYDSVYDCPAANDNASGVAALLEIANCLKDKKSKRTLRFVAFTNEEPPFFRTEKMGSFQHALGCFERKESIAAMICLETIGFYTSEPNSQKYPHPLIRFIAPSVGNFVAFISNFQSSNLLNKCLKSFGQATTHPSKGLALPMFIRGVKSSDHANFWKFGYPAIMVTDTANYRYPHYHDAQDTPDKLDYNNLARVVTGLQATIRDLGNAI